MGSFFEECGTAWNDIKEKEEIKTSMMNILNTEGRVLQVPTLPLSLEHTAE